MLYNPSSMKIIFVHGYTASHTADWYPQISKELDTLEIPYTIPDLPGGKTPHADAWVEMIHKEVIKSREPIIMVAHSLGTRAALLYLEKYSDTHLHALILVAPLANRLENADRRNGEAYPDFFIHKIDLGKIKLLAPIRIVMHSMDDASVPYEQGRELSRDLDASLLTYRDRGHFSEPENYEYTLDVIRNLMKK